ncbi:MAG: 2-oxo acid dehydrogenase subunit E2 [Gammaproteobacteria bacterium]|jgi:pyruvate dehydrogenase E2 component (dihydrolipoamide acetyltransferase)|nr:2-oxo acid dehydrogenase subunit E2 [Gammaproteobacteria bacterium]MDP7418262.1 2-oxo acid dehydrogenase subunit E2 [Gammaproteobacteria bacterium]MDP7659930.1 2-oxo acid dehydrogenase subunit E2 [Gammaproteobacteria bacterium]HJP38866.1 2-oxo acid dehydrogenase subunit E2 [Gammaproteobacteria bacterium]
MANHHQVRVPDLGDFDAVEIVEVMVAVGDHVSLEDPLIMLETDKAALEVPSTAAGMIAKLLVATGMRVSQGDPIVVVETTLAAPEPDRAAPDRADRAGSAPVAATVAAVPPVSRPAAVAPAPVSRAPAGLPPINEQTFGKAHASPAVRSFARELGVNLAQVTGTGRKARILHDDIKAFVKAVMQGQTAVAADPAWPSLPEVDFGKYGQIEVKPLSRIQKISGPRLHASWVNYPHVTQHDEADITDLEERRQQLKGSAREQGVPLTPLAFIIKAVAIALGEFPVFNTSMSADGKSLVHKKYFHLGFAADTPNGLLVPVIRDVEQKDVMSIASELSELSALARTGKLTLEQMRGGTFTVSSLGGIGGTHFTPIVNPPEVAILGVGRSAIKPVYLDGEFIARLILPISLSYDHRIIDGATGVRFTTYLANVLADVERLMLG